MFAFFVIMFAFLIKMFALFSSSLFNNVDHFLVLGFAQGGLNL
jgi:hypothetical protein